MKKNANCVARPVQNFVSARKNEMSSYKYIKTGHQIQRVRSFQEISPKRQKQGKFSIINRFNKCLLVFNKDQQSQSKDGDYLYNHQS